MAHPAKVNGVPQAISVIPFAGMPAREEEGWEGDEEVVIGKVDADGTGRGCQTVKVEAQGVTPRRTWMGKQESPYGGQISSLGWSAMVQGVSKSVETW